MKTLTGRWNGLYSYAANWRQQVQFTADLVHADEWLGGSIDEVAGAGVNAGSAIRATLSGRVIASSVTFLKIYDQNSPIYDTVSYAGSIAEDRLEIYGNWKLPGNESGMFLMIRAPGIQAAIGERRHESIDTRQ